MADQTQSAEEEPDKKATADESDDMREPPQDTSWVETEAVRTEDWRRLFDGDVD